MFKRGLLIISLILILSGFVIAESPTKFLMSMDGADSISPYPRNSISLSGNTHHETDQSQLGSSSMYFDGNDILTISDSEAIELGEEDFTIDFWVRSTRGASGTNQFVFAKGTQDVDVSYYFNMHGSGYFEFGMIGDSGWIGSVNTYQKLNPSANTWYHVAAERFGSSLLLYVDGKLMDNETISGAPKNNGDGLIIGNVDGRSYYLSGYIDEFRMVKGQAKWTENFTVPSSPHDIDENTSLLIHSDHSDGSTAIVDSAGVGVHDVSVYGNPILKGPQYSLETGDGSDGSFVVSSLNTVVNNYAYITDSTVSQGSLSFNVNDASSFSIGDEILIIQMQHSSNHGVYEFSEITGKSGNQITISNGLENNYYSGIFDTNPASATQIVRIPQYTNVTINSDASITASAWNGYTGGIVIFRSQGNVNVIGSVDVKGKGFRAGIDCSGGSGRQGESYPGYGTFSRSANGGAGGGVSSYCTSAAAADEGGSAGHSSSGQNGLDDNYGNVFGNNGLAGNSYGQSNLDKFYLGSGGGRSVARCAGEGGSGGGGIIILANNITVSGNIDSNGNTASAPGSGGSIYLSGNNLNIGTNLVTSNGGSGNCYGGISASSGRIRLDARSITGSSSPASYNGLNTPFDSGVMEFDGSDDYLSIPDSDDWDFGTEDFTIDFWIYPSDSTTDYDNILGHWTGGTGTSWVIEFYNASASSRTVAMWINGAGPVLQGSTELPTNQFTHVAVVRKGSDLKLYIDGVQDAYYDISTTSLVTSTSPLLVGTTQVSLSLYAKMDELRISKGVARWTSNFTVPSEPHVADENTTLLLHFDGDESSSQHSVQFNGDADMNATEYKFDGSYYFDGDGDYLSVSSSNDFDFGSDDFTIDFWFKRTNGDTLKNHGLVGYGDSANNNEGWMIWTDWDQKAAFQFYNGSDSTVTIYPGFAYNDQTWYHVALVREEDMLSAYIDGELLESKPLTGSLYLEDPNLYIGKYIGAGGYPNTQGYIDEVRITKGLARWTSDFTPPTRPYNQPVTSSFGGDSTDFSSISDSSYVENMVLANSGARIGWNNAVNVDGADLDSNVKMGSNFVSVNAAALDSSLNSSANVTLDVDHCNEVAIYYAPEFYDNSADIISNGQLCTASSEPACTNIQCSDGTLTFTVEHFDSYTGSSGAPVPEFSDYALILAIALTLVGIGLLRRR